MRQLYFLLILFLSILTNQIFAQPDTLWTKIHGGPLDYRAYDIEQTSDGGYMIVGSVTTLAGDDDVYLMRTDSSGDTIWTKTYGNNLNEQAFCINPTSDNGFILVGNRREDRSDIYVLKIDSVGDTLWTKIYGDESSEHSSFVMETSDNGLLIVGDKTNNSTNDKNVYLVKTNSDGDTIWTKQYGGIDSDEGKAAIELAGGEFIIVGTTQSFGAGGSDVYLIKTNSVGDTIWTKTYGGSNDDIGISVINTGSGFAIGGHTNSFSSGDLDFYLISTNYDGDTSWTRVYGGADDDVGFGVAQANDNGFLLCGYTESFGAGNEDIYVVKYKNNGDFDWDETYGFSQEEIAYSILVTSDGGYVIPGNTESFYSGRDAIYLIKTKAEISGFQANRDIYNPVSFKLYQNYPNPFNPGTNIQLSILQRSFVTLEVFNSLGERVGILVSEELSGGIYNYDWDASGLTSGIYFYKLQAGSFVETKKMVLLR